MAFQGVRPSTLPLVSGLTSDRRVQPWAALLPPRPSRCRSCSRGTLRPRVPLKGSEAAACLRPLLHGALPPSVSHTPRAGLQDKLPVAVYFIVRTQNCVHQKEKQFCKLG